MFRGVPVPDENDFFSLKPSGTVPPEGAVVSGSFVPVPAGGVPVPVGGVSVVCAGGFAVPPGLSFDSTGGSRGAAVGGIITAGADAAADYNYCSKRAIRITRRTIIRLMAFLFMA